MAVLSAEFLERQASALKLLLIGVLTLTLLIPLALVEGVIAERAGNHEMVLRDIAAHHGGEQRLVGPLLTVPYVYESVTTRVDALRGGEVTERARKDGVAIILPDSATARADLVHEMRRRGIYEAPVYSSRITLDGAFATPDLAREIPDLVEVDWAKAALILGVSDLSGLTDADAVAFGGRSAMFRAGLPAYASGVDDQGGLGFVHAEIELAGAADAALSFKTEIGLNGSRGLSMAPLAGASSFKMTADWPHPSFQGAPLPTEREVNADGFSARWNVPALARGHSRVAVGAAAEKLLRTAAWEAVGFRHVRPGDAYVAATRAVKYGVLFVALTFLACFVLERFGGRRLHPAQYGLVGLSLALFYLLLIALAERIGLAQAYLAAATAIVAMNGAYVGAALRSLRRGAFAGANLALLYAAFYVMLGSEDDALLIGAGLLLAGLALGMAATVRMNEPKRAEAPA